MIELLKIDVTKQQDNLMIKEILYDSYSFSKKSLVKIKNNGGIFLNGQKAYATSRVSEGDLVEIFTLPETSDDIIPQPIPIHVIYEDADIAIINKSPYLVVHPTRNYYLNTLANGLMYYWQSKGETIRFRPVNRLDKDTSGLLIVAKNQYSHHKLQLQIREKSLKRTYHAIVHGQIASDSGIITAPIKKDKEHGTKRIALHDNIDVEAKSAITFYKVINRYFDKTLVELELGTGRTHQIRVHMSFISHPLVGDDLYGGSLDCGIGRQALHAKKLSFFHPITGESLSFEADYPEDFKNLIKHLK